MHVKIAFAFISP